MERTSFNWSEWRQISKNGVRLTFPLGRGNCTHCVQFPLPSGNVRRTPFLDIWRHSDQLNEVRSIRTRDLPSCSRCVHVVGCTRCPGLAYMEGNMRGPSSQDCEKSFAKTGIPSDNLQSRKPRWEALVHIQSAKELMTLPAISPTTAQ